MPIYIEVLGVEPEDLDIGEHHIESEDDSIALANDVYAHIKEEYDYLEITGVATVMNEDLHEKFTGRRPDYNTDQ